jgi:ankyrin repeat protein
VLDDTAIGGTESLRAFCVYTVRTVTDLISRGCNPNAGDGKGWTASHFAAQYGHTNTLLAMQKLYGADLDIDAEDTSGWYVV